MDLSVWTEECLAYLRAEAKQKELAADYIGALEIRQQIRDRSPTNIDNLLGIIFLSFKLKTFNLNASQAHALNEVINLLTEYPSASIEASSLLQVLRLLLSFEANNPIIVEFCQAFVNYYQQRLLGDRESVRLLWELGNVYTELKQIDNASDLYYKAIAIDPEFAAAHFSLGNLDMQLGKDHAAMTKYEKAIQCDRNFAKSYVNLAFLQSKHQRTEEAVDNLNKAIAIDPRFAEAHGNLASVLINLQRTEEAIPHLFAAITLKPDYITARLNLAGILKWQGKIDQAIACLQQAPIAEPEFADTYADLGGILTKQGRTDAAMECFQRALACQPRHAYAFRMQYLVLPIIYDIPEQIDCWRDRFTAGLDHLTQHLSQEQDKTFALELIKPETNFYLVYQGQQDLALQVKYGQIVHQVMALNYPHYKISSDQKSDPPSSNLLTPKKIRLGYISTYFRFHAATRSTLGCLKHRDKENFEVYLYYIDHKIDFMTEAFQQESDVFHHIPANLEAVCDRILADQLDILIFTDIGMHPLTTQIAALRLAPVQCVCWGHPITTGLPTIDYYLSGELMEPPDADAHYSETLIKLPNLGVAYPKPVLPKQNKNRADFNLPDDAVIYISSQSLFKYLPQYDYVFVRIAQQVPQAKFIFFASESEQITERFYQRLEPYFAAADLNIEDYVILMTRLNWENYLHLNILSDVFLDSIGFSGGNTALDAIACKLPIVTLPGEFMRGRLAYAMLQGLQVKDIVAKDEEDYIKIAVKLGLDPLWRGKVVKAMQSRHDFLYDDITCVRAMEEFFKRCIMQKKLQSMNAENIP
jgi:protein O-GlcNAc transferase